MFFKRSVGIFLANKLVNLTSYIQSAKVKRLCKIKNSEICNSLVLGEGSDMVVEGNPALIRIHKNVQIKKFCSFLIHPSASLEIGENVFINNYCSVNCLGTIIIKENTLLGEGVKIYDHNHEYHFDNEKLIVEQRKFSVGKVIIGKNCWIGSNVTILKGVEIGDNVIIGANCLIYKSVKANSIVKNTSALTIE